MFLQDDTQGRHGGNRLSPGDDVSDCNLHRRVFTYPDFEVFGGLGAKHTSHGRAVGQGH